MAEQSTFIKLDRNIVRWRWWKNYNTLHVFLWLLLNANVYDHNFENTVIRRGQVATSYKTIGESCGLTIMQVRTALSHLKLTGEITSEPHSKYQVITIVNYSSYQDIPTGKITDNQQASNSQLTVNQQQYKKVKKVKKVKNIPPKSPTGGLTPSGEQTYDNLHAETMMPRDMGTYEDIPSVYRDGTYQSFKTWEEYWDWSNQ